MANIRWLRDQEILLTYEMKGYLYAGIHDGDFFRAFDKKAPLENIEYLPNQMLVSIKGEKFYLARMTQAECDAMVKNHDDDCQIADLQSEVQSLRKQVDRQSDQIRSLMRYFDVK